MATVHILGGGTPTPTPSRFGSSYVFQFDKNQLMIDCGPAATQKLVNAGFWPTEIDYLFITHHHFDHDADLPCFLLCRWDQSIGKENRLQIYGPTLTEKITEGIIGEDGLFAHDWKARVNHPLSQRIHVNRGGKLPRKPPIVFSKDIGPGEVIEKDDFKVTTALAEHVQPYLDSLAYRIDTKEGSVVFTGDTQPCDSVIELSKGADALVCMCWDDQEVMDSTGEMQGQCGTVGAAEMAQKSGVRKLILSHVGPNLSQESVTEKAISDVGAVFDGEVVVAKELMQINI
ncbi:MAG: MBL fold metallo-hydrolase [SAR202 cluster bacterium]|jgi:ribonuclease Z|nr:MBL fold metallo-hydrolase [SAR202 cluster bacterium]|tara:strand:+ start:3748 stop:4608 length:861 start_codon:yes stop_codon:yes gene_type:complete